MSLQEYANAVTQGLVPPLSHDEFAYQFRADDEDINLVTNYFQENGFVVESIDLISSQIRMSGSTDACNKTFDIRLYDVELPSTLYTSYVGAVSIPISLKNILLHVLGLDNQPVFQPMAVSMNPAVASDPNSKILKPQQMAQAYQFPEGTGAGVCVGIIQLGGGYTAQNLTTSFGANNLSIPTIVDVSVLGGANTPNNTSASVEVVLDSLIVGGIAPQSKQAVYFAPNSIPGFIAAINAALNDRINLPSVISISWGAIETAPGFNAMEIPLQRAVSQNVTVIAASGDWGTKATPGSPSPSVLYPSSSNYVLSCGGTTLQLDPNNTIANEFVWNQENASTGGGISTLYALPIWQTNLASKTYPAGAIVALPRRGVPDVGGNADPATGAQRYYGLANTSTTTGGTSATAPLYAGLIARIVSIIGRNVGFVNQIFYSKPTAFRDITQGNNAVPDLGVPTGFSATVGWDACTGLGSPIGQSILQMFYYGQVKTAPNTWSDVKTISVKTSSTTWSPVKTAWVKTVGGWMRAD